MIVAEASYEVTDPTIDSQIVTLQASGADIFFDVTTPKFAAQAIRKVYDIGWKPLHILNNVSNSVSVGAHAGGAGQIGGVDRRRLHQGSDQPAMEGRPGIQGIFRTVHDKYYPEGDIGHHSTCPGYSIAQGVVHVLKPCGDDLSRENVMKQMASIKDLQVPMMLPGIKWNTSASDFYLVESAQLARFDGKEWVRFGKIIGR